MEANSTHISFETAKLLKDCGVKSKYKFFFDNYDKEELSCSISNNEHFFGNIIKTYPAYTWQEIASASQTLPPLLRTLYSQHRL